MLLLSAVVRAASLDNLEVGGPWGTPAAANPTAVWWNPAGVAAGEGTRIYAEGAPTFASISYQRAEPHGGTDIYELSGVMPYFGVTTDLGIDGLGFGLGLAVPTVRGGIEADGPGPGAWNMREGDVKAIHGMFAASYEIVDRVAIGGALHVVRSSWVAKVDTDTLPDLAAAIEAEGEETTYTDANLEDPEYTATLQFEELTDVALTFSAGARLKLDPGLTLALAYVHGSTVDNVGGVDITFGCPPESDTTGRYAAERAGTCYSTVHADASVAYTLPNRVHGAIRWEPNDVWDVTLMGGWVHWSVYEDFVVSVSNPQIESAEGKALIEQSRRWARAATDSGWAGLDLKVHPAPPWTVGGRLMYDSAAIPNSALSTNNYDANAWMLSAMAAWKPVPALQIGASWTHHFLAEREVTDSAFYQTLEGTPPEDRYNYPHSNGTYGGSIDRIGVNATVAIPRGRQ